MTTEITRQSLRLLMKDIDDALKIVSEKHGVKLGTGSARFSPSSCTIKIEGVAVGDDGAVPDAPASDLKAREDMKVRGILHGASERWLDQCFDSRGRVFKIIGLLPKRHQNCILAGRLGLDGKIEKRFVFSVADIKAKTLRAAP